MGISKLEPCFRQSAGVRLTTIFLTGKANPAFFIAALILSRDSHNAASGNPTTTVFGRPPETSTSTPTLTASTPTIAALQILASMNILFSAFLLV